MGRMQRGEVVGLNDVVKVLLLILQLLPPLLRILRRRCEAVKRG